MTAGLGLGWSRTWHGPGKRNAFLSILIPLIAPCCSQPSPVRTGSHCLTAKLSSSPVPLCPRYVVPCPNIAKVTTRCDARWILASSLAISWHLLFLLWWHSTQIQKVQGVSPYQLEKRLPLSVPFCHLSWLKKLKWCGCVHVCTHTLKSQFPKIKWAAGFWW